jgi:pimeloyl-ACP methyl ester carboxylesterase
MLSRLVLPALLLCTAAALADGPGDNDPKKVKPIPPVGIELPPADAAEIQAGLAELQTALKEIGRHELAPDVEIYEKAVRYAVNYREVFDAKGIPGLRRVLKEGLDRANSLKDGKHPWTEKTGYVLRGYRSKIDGSAQPYGLFVPEKYDFKGQEKHRLDFWWHGRGETLSEVNFMAGVQNASGIIPAPGAFILYPYGRFCNANKFAGEVDSFECLAHAKRHYRIDESRLVARGFSMGGAACWQYAVHYPTLWCAAAPGAGFSETPEFLRVFQGEDVSGAPWYEQKLWRMYNATDYAQNIFNLPTVAYSGEKDSQKQAADIMERSMKKLGLDLVHIIGPGAGHGYEKGAKAEVNRRIDEIVAKGKPKVPSKIKFVTYTLRYNQSGWIRVMGLEKHWEEASVHAVLQDGVPKVTTKNVKELWLVFPEDQKPTGDKFVIDGTEFPLKLAPESVGVTAEKVNGKWVSPHKSDPFAVKKRPTLQGPIDDAFFDRFIFVRPTGKPLAAATGEWTEKELKHAIEHWRKQFRGDPIVKNDTEVTDEDIRTSNLVLWGDVTTNAMIRRMAGKLPVSWALRGSGAYVNVTLEMGKESYDGSKYMPVLIHPNPLNPTKYIVLNSGFTYREYDYLNNARQAPKLPDYAILDITSPPTTRHAGKVVRAGFFGEAWQLLPNDGQ